MERIHVDDSELEDIGIITHYKGNPFTGILFDTFEDGKISLELNLVNGLKEGFTTSFYKNGKVKVESFFKKDVQEGKENVYHEEGFLVQSSVYQNNFPVEKSGLLTVLKKPLTLHLLTNLFIVLDYESLKSNNVKFIVDFIEEDFYQNFESLSKDVFSLNSKTSEKMFSGLRSSIQPYTETDQGDVEEWSENPIRIPGIFGFSRNNKDKVFVITDTPEVETEGFWDFRTTNIFEDVDELITFFDSNYTLKSYSTLKEEEKERVTYITEG